MSETDSPDSTPYRPPNGRQGPPSRRATDRGVSEVLGAMFLFAGLIMGLAFVQAFLIPTDVQQSEGAHNAEVQEDLVSLATDIDRTAGSGDRRTSPVNVGMRHQNRLFFITPGPSTGWLETKNESSKIAIFNARAADGDSELRDYWHGGKHNFTTTARLTYSIQYTQYSDTPVSFVEHGMVFNDWDSGGVSYFEGSPPVQGNRISLTAIDADFSRGGVDPVALSIYPRTSEPRTVSVTGDGENIKLKLPTGATREAWADVYNTTDSTNIVSISVNETNETAMIELDGSETYELRLASVTVDRRGVAPDSPGPNYVVPIGPRDFAIPEGSTQTLTVEVRDRFNAPVSGADVDFKSLDPANITVGGGPSVNTTSGTGGRASVTLNATNNISSVNQTDIAVTIDDASRPREQVTFTVTVFPSGGGASLDAAPSISAARPTR